MNHSPDTCTGVSPRGRQRRAGLPQRVVALALAACCAVLAGCAGGLVTSFNVAPGTPRASVIQQWGQPVRSVRLPQGERLQYSLQPLGQYVVMVDLDASGNVLTSRQVLTPAEFARVVDGQWTRADIEREFGPPAKVDRIMSWPGDILTYRWNDGSDMFFWVYLDAQQVVQRTQQGMEFVNAPDRE